MPRPPRLPDAEIQKVIDELRAQGRTVTGLALRAELHRRHGHRGGVTRMYRILHGQTALPRPAPAIASHTPPPAGDFAQLQAELVAAVERARLAEHREETHQTRWAGEIHQLRDQVRTLNHAAHRLPLLEAELQDRRRELAAAYRRIADLESQLR